MQSVWMIARHGQAWGRRRDLIVRKFMVIRSALQMPNRSEDDRRTWLAKAWEGEVFRSKIAAERYIKRKLVDPGLKKHHAVEFKEQ